MVKFWVQDHYDEWGEVWHDSFGFATEAEAIDWYNKLIADPIWLHDGKRKWRVVERINAIIVSQC